MEPGNAPLLRTDSGAESVKRVPTKGALRHFLELDGASAEHLAAHQGRKTVGGIAIHALGSSLAHHLGQEAQEPTEAPASVHGAPVSVKQSAELLERLHRMGTYDSQDFDPVDNDLEKEVQRSREYVEYTAQESWRWFVSFMIGVVMGFLGFVVDWAVLELNTLKFTAARAAIRASNSGFFWPYTVFCLFCVGYAAVSGSLVSWGSAAAAGSGIPEIKTYLNGVRVPGLLQFRTLWCKLVAVAFSMGGGLIAGKDGPLIHAGGIVGGGIGKLSPGSITAALGVKLPRGWAGPAASDAGHRDCVLIGTAAGLAAAFSTPLGGLLLAIEQGSSFLTISLFWRGFLATCTCTVVLHMLACTKAAPVSAWEMKLGIRRELGLYADSIANYGSHYFFYAWELPIFVLMGCLGGLSGAAWIKCNIWMTALRGKYVPARLVKRRLVEVMAVAWLIATVFFVVSFVSPCQSLPSERALGFYEAESELDDFYAGGALVDRRGLKHFPRLWCEEGEYSSFGQLFFTPLIQQVRLIIHLGETLPPELLREARPLGWGALLLTTGLLFPCSLISFGIGAPTGLFMAMLVIGGGWGHLMGLLVSAITRRMGMTSHISLPAYTVVGAAASLGGVTRMTISITVLVMEITGGLQIIVPLMLTIFFAKLVGDSLSYSIYDTHIKIKGAPVLPEADMETHQQMVADKLTVGQLMTTSLLALPPLVPVQHLVATLRASTHHSFPVTTEVETAMRSQDDFELQGVVTRGVLLELLRCRIAMTHLRPGEPAPPSSSHVPAEQTERLAMLADLVSPSSTKADKAVEDAIFQDLTEREMGAVLDLRPFMQRTPFVVHGNASLARTYRLFRTLGLHHLFVGPARPRVIGLVTRKDLTEENSQLVLGEQANALAPPPAATLPFIPYHPEELRRRGHKVTGHKKPRSPSAYSLDETLETVAEGSYDGDEPAEQGDDESASLIAHV